jgi:hypothetical protein
LSVCVDYRTDLYDAATVSAMADGLVSLLGSGTREPRTPLNDLWLPDTSPHAG